MITPADIGHYFFADYGFHAMSFSMTLFSDTPLAEADGRLLLSLILPFIVSYAVIAAIDGHTGWPLRH